MHVGYNNILIFFEQCRTSDRTVVYEYRYHGLIHQSLAAPALLLCDTDYLCLLEYR